MKTSKMVLGVVGVLGTVAGSSLAHEGDVGFTILGQRITVGIVEDTGSGEVVVPGQRVFGGEIGLTIPGFGDEPGFFGEAGTLDLGSQLGFNVMGALRKWDEVNQTFVVASEALRLERPDGVVDVTTPATDVFTPGWAFTFPGAGDFDDHPNFFVENRTGAGIYSIELRFFTDQNGIADSDSFWLVINDGLDEAVHEAAIEYVEDVVVPAPGAIGVGLAGLLMAARRRRA
ncbi:MAG: hypothetical protein SFZ23_01390 [Planctomycetota bacterium]|nr:hypothetical protein [Planctomycetota bacterium]